MKTKILSREDYRALRMPFDRYLPESVPAEEVEAELDVMQARFRKVMAELGEEGEDWELPDHYQHVRVFYAYLLRRKVYQPRLAEIIRETMEGFEKPWIGSSSARI